MSIGLVSESEIKVAKRILTVYYFHDSAPLNPLGGGAIENIGGLIRQVSLYREMVLLRGGLIKQVSLY